MDSKLKEDEIIEVRITEDIIQEYAESNLKRRLSIEELENVTSEISDNLDAIFDEAISKCISN